MVMEFGLAWLVAIAAPAVAAPAWLNPSQIAADIQSQGAKIVVDRLWNTPSNDPDRSSRWDVVVDQIWNGERDWIALAPDLAPGTDGGAAESLAIALAHALPLAPAQVLAAVDRANGPAMSVDRVCSVPFIEGAVKDLPGYLRAARRAVEDLNDADLAAVRAGCLTELSSAERDLLKPPP